MKVSTSHYARPFPLKPHINFSFIAEFTNNLFFPLIRPCIRLHVVLKMFMNWCIWEIKGIFSCGWYAIRGNEKKNSQYHFCVLPLLPKSIAQRPRTYRYVHANVYTHTHYTHILSNQIRLFQNYKHNIMMKCNTWAWIYYYSIPMCGHMCEMGEKEHVTWYTSHRIYLNYVCLCANTLGHKKWSNDQWPYFYLSSCEHSFLRKLCT